MLFNKTVLRLGISASMALMSSAYGVNIVNEDNAKAVGDVTWHKYADVNAQDLISEAIPNQSSRIFFIRPNDNDTEQTSANIAINDRFQVSLQPGNYTQVYSCPGINRLSAQPTRLKTNDLLQNTSSFELAGGVNYFFYVDVDAQGHSTIQQIDEAQAIEQLAGKRYQAHQITRVVPNCPVVVRQPPISAPAPVPTPQPLPVPVLKEPVSIELEVLFDNDKTIIKPQYMSEIQEVADFMKEYSNTTAVIEGHTDSNASVSYNQSLSERRAKAVKDTLVSRFGIDQSRLSSVGYSELRPRATNATAEGRALNRRVIAVITERQ